MTSTLQKVLHSKRAERRELPALPVAEKLRMLDAMRERDVAIREAGAQLRAEGASDALGHHLRRPR